MSLISHVYDDIFNVSSQMFTIFCHDVFNLLETDDNKTSSLNLKTKVKQKCGKNRNQITKEITAQTKLVYITLHA